MPKRDFFAELCAHFNATPDRRGWVGVDCPWCGAEANKRGSSKFAFSEFGYKCLSCGVSSGRLKPIIQKVGLWSDSVGGAPVRTAPPVKRPTAAPRDAQPTWAMHATELIEGYCNHPQKFELWESYKPVSRENIIRHKFGVGVLPGQTMTRLIVPLWFDGKLVGIKGRVLPGQEAEAKWISAAGSTMNVLWGIEYVPMNADYLFICENYVDACLVSQTMGYEAVSGGGARVLSDGELEQIKRLKPKNVIVMYDNDLVGSAVEPLRSQLERERREGWLARHPDKTVPPPPLPSMAFKLERVIREAGLNAKTFTWPSYAPPKADALWAMQQTL